VNCRGLPSTRSKPHCPFCLAVGITERTARAPSAATRSSISFAWPGGPAAAQDTRCSRLGPPVTSLALANRSYPRLLQADPPAALPPSAGKRPRGGDRRWSSLMPILPVDLDLDAVPADPLFPTARFGLALPAGSHRIVRLIGVRDRLFELATAIDPAARLLQADANRGIGGTASRTTATVEARRWRAVIMKGKSHCLTEVRRFVALLAPTSRTSMRTITTGTSRYQHFKDLSAFAVERCLSSAM
jgi:hypothetical protein